MSDTPRTYLLEQHILERLARCQATDDPIGEEICEAAIIGLRWNKNSSLEEWFPFTAQKIIVLERELADVKERLTDTQHRNGANIVRLERAEAELAEALSRQPSDMVLVPRELVERMAILFRSYADFGMQEIYSDGEPTPNSKLCSEIDGVLRTLLAAAQPKEKP